MLKNIPKEPGIYIITNLLDNKVYIGQSKSKEGIYRRLLGHLRVLRNQKDSRHLQRAWDHYGKEVFKFEVLLLCPRDQCDYWEDYYIEVFQSWRRDKGYNLMRKSWGVGRISEETKDIMRKRTFSPEHRMKISEANRRRGPMSEETKRKIGEGSSKKVFTPEYRENLSKAQRKVSKESRKNHGDKLRGKPLSEHHKNRISEGHQARRKREAQPPHQEEQV